MLDTSKRAIERRSSSHDERTAQALGPKSIAFAAMAAKITTFRNLVLAHR